MNLAMPGHLAERFTSEAQRTREISETWGEENLFCAACPSPRLQRLPGSTKGKDFVCPKCEVYYQLKAHRSTLGNRVADGQYDAMMSLLSSNARPHFLLMQYQRADWSVLNLVLVPSFLLPPSSIHRRKPTWPKGRNKPWVGCDVMLDRVPPQGRISLIANRQIFSPKAVRSDLQQLSVLQKGKFESRGWKLEILRVVTSLGKAEFTNHDVYAHESELAAIFPHNSNIQEKIRQQLQYLRNSGFLEHVSSGHWKVK
jgi:type II restriction enzyme